MFVCVTVLISAFTLISTFYDWSQRITISEILADEWFKKDYKRPVFDEKYDTNLDDVAAAFEESEESQKWVSVADLVNF